MVNFYTLHINKKITNGNYTDLQRPRGFSGPMARVVSAALSLAGITHRDSGSVSQIVSTKRVDYRTGHSVLPDPICSTASSAHRTGHGCEESLWIHKPVRDAYRKLERVSLVPKTEEGRGAI